jgi:DNA repair exonuclease SbcCD ATPase subunit
MALDNEFILSELIKSGSAALNQQVTEDGTIIVDTAVKTDGDTFGYVERPVYNETQLVKAVDVVVDELIGAPQKDAPAVVLKETYDDLRAQLDAALQDIRDLQKNVDDLTTQNENLRNQIEQLNQELDLQKLLKASADNERDAVVESLKQVTVDLQAALTKGTKEAVERVSREASLQGLLAEKETFVQIQKQSKEAIDRANSTITTLQTELGRVAADFANAISNFISSK